MILRGPWLTASTVSAGAHCADGAAFNSRRLEHAPTCLTDTRVDLLKRIMRWSEAPNDACIFWLNGMAGTGKSTIARTVARKWADEKRLGASFFFSRGQGDLAHASKFFTTLAYQLAHAQVSCLPADVRKALCKAIYDNPDIHQGFEGLGDGQRIDRQIPRDLADRWQGIALAHRAAQDHFD